MRPMRLVVEYVNDWGPVVDGARLMEVADPAESTS